MASYSGLVDIVPNASPQFRSEEPEDEEVFGPDSSLLIHLKDHCTFEGYFTITTTIIVGITLLWMALKENTWLKKGTRFIPGTAVFVFIGFILTTYYLRLCHQ